MTDHPSKTPAALVVLAAIAVAATVLIALNMQHEFNTALPMAIVAAGGLIGLGLAARR